MVSETLRNSLQDESTSAHTPLMTTQQDLDLITGQDMMDYLRAIAPGHYTTLLEWNVAMYVRGILTEDETLGGPTGCMTADELATDIRLLKGSVARWMLS